MKNKKDRVSISINKQVRDSLSELGEQYGLNFSHMVERAARYYLEDMTDYEIALERSLDPKQKTIRGNELRKKLTLED